MQSRRPQGRRMAEERVAFFQSVLGTMSIYLNNAGSAERDQTPSVVVLYGADNKRFPYKHSITSMTAAELAHYKEFINMAIEMAEPIVEERDRIAAEAMGEGDDSYGRVYRQPSRIVVRPRLLGPDDHSLMNRLIEKLRASPHVVVDANKFSNRRTEMDFWSDGQEDPAL